MLRDQTSFSLGFYGATCKYERTARNEHIDSQAHLAGYSNDFKVILLETIEIMNFPAKKPWKKSAQTAGNKNSEILVEVKHKITVRQYDRSKLAFSFHYLLLTDKPVLRRHLKLGLLHCTVVCVQCQIF